MKISIDNIKKISLTKVGFGKHGEFSREIIIEREGDRVVIEMNSKKDYTGVGKYNHEKEEWAEKKAKEKLKLEELNY